MGLWGRTKMLEQYCCKSPRNMCVGTIDNYNPPVLRLKTDKTEYPENPYKDFLGEYRYMWLQPVYNCGRGKRCRCHDMARRWFEQKSPTLVVYFFIDLYGGDIESAMKATGNFKQLWEEFQIWFDRKRRDFRMTFDITDSKKQILENGKRPLSHGGVANLLKILTKTMEKQGSSIENIAKVQYTICMQAGIYIPDEFIEDVAVSLSIVEK